MRKIAMILGMSMGAMLAMPMCSIQMEGGDDLGNAGGGSSIPDTPAAPENVIEQTTEDTAVGNASMAEFDESDITEGEDEDEDNAGEESED